MAFINFENLPSENTPLTGGDGGNLNEMQKIVNVSNEVDEDYRVNLLETKNLFDKDNFNELSGLLSSQTQTLASNQYFRTIFIKCKPSTTYTASKISSTWFRVGGFASVPTLGASYISMEVNDNATSITYTTPSNCNYLAITYYDSNSDNNLQAILDSIQIEEGNEATTYEAFIPNQIVVDNEKYTDTLNVGSVVDSRSRVNFLYYGNSNIFTTINATTGSNLTDTGSVNTNAPWGYTDYIEVYSGKKYNLKRSDNQTLGNTPAICFYDNSKTFISGIAYGNSRSFDLTIPSNAKYVRISYILEYSSLYMFNCLESPSIYVDNEMLVSKNVYSGGEVVIGEWFGKPLYRKVLNTTISSGNTSGELYIFPTTNYGNVIDTKVRFNSSGSTDYVYSSYYSSGSDYMRFFVRNNTIQIRLGSNSSGFNIQAIIEYTKTTD